MFLIGAQSVFAQGLSIAVVDFQQAVLGSEQAKERIAEIKKQLAPDQNEIRTLGEQIQSLQAKAEQDDAVMSESEKKKLAKEIEDKMVDYQFLVQKFQKTQNESQQELFGELGPKLQQAIQAVIDEGKYDLVLRRDALVYVNAEVDITKKVTEQLNLIK